MAELYERPLSRTQRAANARRSRPQVRPRRRGGDRYDLGKRPIRRSDKVGQMLMPIDPAKDAPLTDRRRHQCAATANSARPQPQQFI